MQPMQPKVGASTLPSFLTSHYQTTHLPTIAGLRLPVAVKVMS